MKKIIFVLFFFLPLYFYAQLDINDLLINAILNNNEDSVLLLLEQGADPNYETIWGLTPLMYAVENNNYDIVKILIDKGANINKIPPYDPPVLSFTVMNYLDSIFDLLISKNANVDIVDYSGRTPLYYAIIYGNAYAADQLLFHGANPDTLVLGWSPLELATYYDDTLLVNMLVYYGANVNSQDNIGFTALHVSAQYDKIKAANALIHNGARLDLLSDDLASPIDIAIYQRNNKTFKYLFDQKPDLDNFVNSKFDSYQLAVLRQNYFAKKVFKKNGWHEEFWAVDYLLYVNQSLCFGDYFIGFDVGVKELFSNTEVLFGFNKRLFDKRVWFYNGYNTYLQLWESRWSISALMKKNFYLFSTNRLNHYLSLGFKGIVSYANYHGSLRREINKGFSPILGYELDYYRFILSADFYYFSMPYRTTFPVFLGFSIGYRLPTYSLKIALKKKSPVIYGRSL